MVKTITISIPDDKIDKIVDSFCSQYNYQNEIDDGTGAMKPNPITRPQFAKRMVNQFVKEVYVAAQAKTVDETRATAIATAEGDVKDITVS